MTQATIPTWKKDPAKESAMGPSHVPIWRRLIELVPETDLAAAAVLDFGCNQGGFLRMLHATRPFRFGLGVDIATDSLARAEAAKGELPIDYQRADRLADHPRRFDIAFSHEVVYLVPDIAAHGRDVRAALRPGGVYYAATACHTDNRLWPAWRKAIAETSRLDFPDRSLDDYVQGFAAAGFEVAIRPFGDAGFVSCDAPSAFYPRAIDRIYAATEAKILFRLVRRD